MKPDPMPVSAQRGFTLIELMIVISVLSLLLALAYPAYQSRLLHAKRAEGHAALLQVMLQQERHFSLNNRYRLFAGNSNETGFKWFPATIRPQRVSRQRRRL